MAFLQLQVASQPCWSGVRLGHHGGPTSSLLPIYAVRYDPNPENQLNAAAASMLSVLISVVTIPIWYSFLFAEVASLIVSTIFIRRVYNGQIKPMYDTQKEHQN